jgi:hypothetical protein
MPQFLTGRLKGLASSLGRCPFCMQKAFLVMGAAWGVTALTMSFAGPLELSLAAGVIAVITTILWAAHAFTFIVRRKSRTSAVHFGSRRSALPILAKGLALALLASTVPGLAAAQQSCDRCEPNCTRSYPPGTPSWTQCMQRCQNSCR